MIVLLLNLTPLVELSATETVAFMVSALFLVLGIGKRTNVTEFLWGCYLIHIYSDFKISILVIMFKGKKSYWNKKGF